MIRPATENFEAPAENIAAPSFLSWTFALSPTLLNRSEFVAFCFVKESGVQKDNMALVVLKLHGGRWTARLLAAGVDAAGRAGDIYPVHFPFINGTYLIGDRIAQRCMHLTSPHAMAMWEELCARSWSPTLQSVQLFLWGAQRARTIPHLCLENDAFKNPENHLDKIWLEAAQVGYFSNPMEQLDGKRAKYLAPGKKSVVGCCYA